MLVTTVEEWDKVVEKLRGSVDPFGDHVIAYDTETVDRGYPNVKITGFSLAWYEDKTSIEGCYVPLNHTSKTVEPPTEQIESDLREILEDPNIQTTCHNLKYDRNITLLMDENDPIHIHENTFDTMIVGWMVNTPGVGTRSQRLNDHGSHGLKDWVKEVFDHDIGNLKRLAPTEKVDGSTVIYTDQVEPKDLEQYATDDAVYTLKLRQWLIQNKLLGREEELWDIYNELENPFIFVLAELEKWGMELDDELLASMGEDMTEELDSINRRMYDLRPVEDFEMTEELASEIERAAIAYEELEKEEDISPYEKGQRRNTIFMACGLKDHPVEEKIRDDSLRDEVINHPDLSHKIFNPRSDKQLNRVFFEECGIEPLDEKSDKSGLHSTNGDFLKEWQHEHQIAKELLRLRRLTQLNGVFVEGILKRLPEDNRVRTRYSMAISTGRLSSSDPNLQNIVKSDEFPVRKCFQGTGCVKSNIEVYEEDDQGDPLHYKVENDGGFFVINNKEVESWGGPNPPWPILVSDYGQLELRILAHEADDAAMKEAFAKGIDIHGATAAKVYDLPCEADEVRSKYPKKRDEVKIVEYGTIYGQGPKGLSRQLGCTEEEAQEIIDDYMGQFPSVENWIDKQHKIVKEQGYVETLSGRKRHLPAGQLPQNGDNWGLIASAERKAVNTPIQGSAADIINKAMVDITKYCLNNSAIDECVFQPPKGSVEHSMDFHDPIWENWLRILVQVHDELIIEMHPSIANWAKMKMGDIMTSSYDLSVPLTVDSAIGKNWQQTKE